MNTYTYLQTADIPLGIPVNYKPTEEYPTLTISSIIPFLQDMHKLSSDLGFREGSRPRLFHCF